MAGPDARHRTTMDRPSFVQVRVETPDDHRAISELVYAAFRQHPQDQPEVEPVEHRIVEALRRSGALTLSLVAESSDGLLGHVAFSSVRIDGVPSGWYGLGPLAVRPDRQRQGVGAALVEDGLGRMRALPAAGVVLVGEPGYYGRFGFRPDPRLIFEGVPSQYFLCLPFGDAVPIGVVTYHDAFSAA